MTKTGKILFAALSVAAAQPALAADAVTTAASPTTTSAATQDLAIKRGQILYTAAGKTVAPIYRITPAGEPQIMLDEQLVTVPAATLSMSGAKLATTLSIPDLRRLGRR